MRITRISDYQSWRFDVDDTTVLIDPWLVGEMTFAAGAWLFRREQDVQRDDDEARALIEASHAIVYTSHYSDHLHRPTLRLVPKDKRILASRLAAGVLEKQGFTDVTVLKDGTAVDVGSVTVRGVAPAFPFTFTAIGAVLEGGGARAYLETHVVSARRLARLGRVDALLAPVEGVRLFGVPLAMPASRTARLVESGSVARLIPTGVDPRRSRGVVPAMLLVTSTPRADLEARVRATGAAWCTPDVGASVELSS